MDGRHADLRQRIAVLQAELQSLEAATDTPACEEGLVDTPILDACTLTEHAAERTPVLAYVASHSWRIHLSGPFVYAMIVPTVLLDICLTVYQAICFRLWSIPTVSRGDFIRLDRHKLAYLNWVEKLNCLYCGYATGVYAYAVELAARTEHFWCPIKHASRTAAPHAYYEAFAGYGDADAWRDHPARKGPGRACEGCSDCFGPR